MECPEHHVKTPVFKPVNAVSLLVGLAGMAIAVYLFYAGAPKFQISWFERRQIIFDYGTLLPLSPYWTASFRPCRRRWRDATRGQGILRADGSATVNELPTARTLVGGYTVEIWCHGCRNTVRLDLRRLIDDGRGDVPLVNLPRLG